ncbi:WD repeat-containing protein 75 isoform X1 [Vespa velutina]|uniref:WD repeat-containing protein 75 isoform X1 n=1 Tax=Vespa velutina TaxID=202808 RepID=UPI001FB1C619|nr:WD repeat-containing protein 75 isoform X1 [Vespa velutina]
MHMKSIKLSKSINNNGLDVDNLIVTRKGGGSIIDHRPLFSEDGETLYVIWKHTLRAYSTQTGDFVQEFESISRRISGIVPYPDGFNTVIGCTDNGQLNFWSCQSGIITKTLNLNFSSKEHTKVKTFHIVKYKNAIDREISQVLITYTTKGNSKIYLLLFDLQDGKCCKTTFIFIKNPEYYVDIIGNHGNNLVAVLHDTDLHILNPSRNLVDKLHKTGKTGRIPTCIAGHPEDECVATGDSTGRVVLWKNLFLTRPHTAVYHWHTLPVTEIAFSKTGVHMYTGGGECVLVKWTIGAPLEKSFLPRLPAPIKHLTIAPDNIYVAVSTLDNGIIVVNPQRKLTSVIQNFTWGIALSCKDLFPAGLVVDPRTNSLVLNSRTGHVQFYSTHTKSLLYNIHITAENFITQERSVNILNTEVTKVALNHDGTWMATVEERDDKISTPEVRLKFWIFDMKKQLFTLNTSVELPHELGINALQFQPNSLFGDEDSLVVTTGKDQKFKLWNLIEPTSIYKKTKHWHCYGTGNYHDLSATDAAFSMDGSLLGIGFGSSLTIWEPDTCTLKSSLRHSQYPYTIMRIEFGKQEACNLIVVVSDKHIAVWNILSLSIMWSVSLNVTKLTADPKSIYMAVFTVDNTLYVFSPHNSSPVYVKKSIVETDSSILGAVFVPRLQDSKDSSYKLWQKKSQLYFIDSNQELLALESESEIGDALEIFSRNQNISLTPFSNFVASQTVSNKEENISFFHESFRISGKEKTDELFNVAAHTLPPMKMLCATFIMSLLSQKDQSSNDKFSRSDDLDNLDNLDDLENEEVEENEDNIKHVKTIKREPSPIPMNINIDESNIRLIHHNWSFLSTILPDEEIIEK